MAKKEREAVKAAKREGYTPINMHEVHGRSGERHASLCTYSFHQVVINISGGREWRRRRRKEGKEEERTFIMPIGADVEGAKPSKDLSSDISTLSLHSLCPRLLFLIILQYWNNDEKGSIHCSGGHCGSSSPCGNVLAGGFQAS